MQTELYKNIRAYKGADVDSGHFMVGVKIQQMLPNTVTVKKNDKNRIKKMQITNDEKKG